MGVGGQGGGEGGEERTFSISCSALLGEAYCSGCEVDLVEHVVHGVKISYGGGDGEGLIETVDRAGHKQVDKGTSVLTNEVSEGKLGLSK